MEKIPLADNSMDVVVSCGSLSYGDPEKVNAEIMRVLRPGGSVILLDALNHNLIYRFNRWIKYKLGHRTISTLKRMPTLYRIDEIQENFLNSNIKFYGSFLWLTLPIENILGSGIACKLNSFLEAKWPPRRQAHKFLFVGLGHKKL